MSQPSLFDPISTVKTSFLEEVWEQINATIKDPLETYIILPSERAALFYRNIYKQKALKTQILPKITTIYSFIDEFSSQKSIDNTTALLELYNCYKDQKQAGAQKFGDFYLWARLLLNDFNELDNYMIDARHLFSNLRDLKNLIEDWSFGLDELSKTQEVFEDFWAELYPLYLSYNKHLNTKGIAYGGKKVRHFAEDIELFVEAYPSLRFHFVGFNALNRAEEEIIESLCREGMADVYWDIDPYYTENEVMEAGKFFPAPDQSPRFHFLHGGIAKNHIDIKLIGVPRAVAQVKIATQLLDIQQGEYPEHHEERINNTVVILANESLLTPFINSIPDSVKRLNLTMGLPFYLNRMYTLIDDLFEFNKQLASDQSVNTSLFRRIINHGAVYAAFGKEAKWQDLGEKRRSINYAEIEGLFENEFERLLLNNWEDTPKIAMNSLLNLSSMMHEQSVRFDLGQAEEEFLYLCAQTASNYDKLCSRHEDLLDLGLIRKLFLKDLSSNKIAFIGEPLKGLQVMGMLETRALDFQHVFVLGANEGIMPAAQNESSLITNDLKKYYGLPTHEKREAIYAYYVYRLLHRATTATFIYNNITDETGSGEMSRFLLQLREELPKFNPNAKITELDVNNGDIPSSAQFSVAKTEGILNKIKGLMKYGMSPSAFNTYLSCPLNFYYKYVIGLSEAEDPDEEVSSAEFGTFLHQILEDIYKGMENQPITATFIKNKIDELENIANQALASTLSSRLEGKILISYKIALFQVERMLQTELERLEQLGSDALIYLGSEATVEYPVTLNTSQGDIDINFKGKIDRIEKTGNTIWVIDYKTGKLDSYDLSIKSWQHIKDQKKTKALQLAFYGLALSDKYKGFQLKSGIVATTRPEINAHALVLDKQEVIYGEDEKREILALFSDIVGEILDPEKAFVHDPASKYCPYCH